MKKFVLVTVFAALALVVSTAFGQSLFDPKNPRVYVVNNKTVVVDQELIRFTTNEKDVRIVWQLPAESEYKFALHGIAVDVAGARNNVKDKAKEFVCHVEENGNRFACINAHTAPGAYKYKITLQIKTGKSANLVLDPIIIND